jgi:hypothetical protein
VVHEILCKTKNDIDLAIYKSIESGLITINQRVGLQNNPGYRKSCSVRIFFSEQHQVLNEQTIIQKEKNDKARPNGCD